MDSSVAIEAVLDKLPVAELDETLSDFIAPFAAVLPDRRLRQVVPLAVRGRIEHGYRFCQEAGLDVEDMRVRSVGRMRKLFILVLLAAQFVMHLMERRPPVGVGWLRQVGGKLLGLQIDRDGPYLLLGGLSAV